MSDASGPSAVVDDRAHHRFVHRTGTSGDIDAGDIDAELVYRLGEDNRFILVHTEVDPSLQGRGVGGQLVVAAIDRARSEGLTIVPWCPYARHWLREHPDATRSVDIDWHTPPQSGDEGTEP
jgi:predicted GNAT family acetyltransferase